MRAIWNGAVIADSDATVLVEGNHPFPPQSVGHDLLRASRRRSLCPYKGLASYFSLIVDGSENRDAAWTYRHPFPWAQRIRGHVAFWHGVEVRP